MRGGEGAFLPAPLRAGKSLLSTIVGRGWAPVHLQCTSARRLRDQDDLTPSLHGGGGGGDQTVEWPEPCPRVEQGTKKNTASQCLVLRTQHLVATYCSPGTHSCFTEPEGEVVPLFSIHLRSKVESGGCGCLGFYPSANTAPRSWSTEFSIQDLHRISGTPIFQVGKQRRQSGTGLSN